jgi:ketosteroid isomerase-like protein
MTRRLILAVFAAIATSSLQLLAHPGHAHGVGDSAAGASGSGGGAMTRLVSSAMVAGFRFIGRNPKTDESIVWKAHQRYADGTASHWVGEPGMRSPAPVTTLAAASQDDAAAVTAWLGTYDAAFNARDLEKLATFYHPDVTIYEGAGINNGWADYRDRHLGPELKAFQNLQFAHSETRVTVLPGGQSAYATSRYTLKAKMGERDIDSEGLATYLLLKGANGAWQIRHSHTSSRARRPAGD